MKHIVFFSLFLSIALVTTAQYVGLTNKEVSSLKKLINKDSSVFKIYSSIKRSADATLNDTANPIQNVVSEGHLSTDPLKIISARSLKDIDKMYNLGITYKIEGKRIYLKKFTEFIVLWAVINHPEGNPINDTKFENLFIAYDMVRSDIPSSERKIIDDWLSKIADEEIRTGKNKAKTTSFNNWNSHRLKVIGEIAYILENTSYQKYIDEELPIQIEKNLLADGSGFDFHERDALHYHVYTLEPLISLATVLKRATKKDFYNYVSPSGASIKRSIEFLKPFVTGEKTHGEYVNSKVAFDKKRADNKESGFEIGASFKPTHAIPVMIEAAYFEPACIEIVKKVMGSEYISWQVLWDEVKK